MPIFFEKEASKSARLAVWQIEESEAFFLEKMEFSEAEKLDFQKISGPARRRHWLASRAVLHALFSKMTGEKNRLEIQKTDGGKPFWPAWPEAHFSLSHSGSLAAAILDEKSPCGIDVQILTPKIERVAPRVLTENELRLAGGSAEKMHFFWGAKEAMYKAYGLGELDFRAHLTIDSFEKGRAEKPPVRLDFSLFDEKIRLAEGVFALVWAVADQDF